MTIPEAMTAELARHPGATARLEKGGKHMRVIVNFKGRERFVAMSATPSDRRADKNRVRDLRRVLRELGA